MSHLEAIDEKKQASIGKKFGFSAKQMKEGSKCGSSSTKDVDNLKVNSKLKGQQVKVDDAFFGAF